MADTIALTDIVHSGTRFDQGTDVAGLIEENAVVELQANGALGSSAQLVAIDPGSADEKLSKLDKFLQGEGTSVNEVLNRINEDRAAGDDTEGESEVSAPLSVVDDDDS